MFYLLSLSLIIFSSYSYSSCISSTTTIPPWTKWQRDTKWERMQERERTLRGREETAREKRINWREEEEEGPAFQSPVSTRDPRPLNHPPQLARNSVLFSPLLCSFLLFSSLRVSPFLFISPPFFDLFYRTTETTDPQPPPPPPSSSSPTSANVPPARFDGRELWEKRRRPARPVTRVTGHDNDSFVKIRLNLWLGWHIICEESTSRAHQLLRNFNVRYSADWNNSIQN